MPLCDGGCPGLHRLNADTLGGKLLLQRLDRLRGRLLLAPNLYFTLAIFKKWIEPALNRGGKITPRRCV
jgi:hypothetical protein